jgi:hypothetical protein
MTKAEQDLRALADRATLAQLQWAHAIEEASWRRDANTVKDDANELLEGHKPIKEMSKDEIVSDIVSVQGNDEESFTELVERMTETVDGNPHLK